VCLGKANWKASKMLERWTSCPQTKEGWLAIYTNNMHSNPKFVICIVKTFHPPCAEVCVGYIFPVELTTYNVSTKSNVLVKCNKAKINKQILVVRIWHKV
jgi:hypothetical protein